MSAPKPTPDALAVMAELFICANCGQVADDVGECFAHPDAEPGWPVFHTRPGLDAYESEV